jgi:hypothetical protein
MTEARISMRLGGPACAEALPAAQSGSSCAGRSPCGEWRCVVQARPVARDEPGDPVRYAVQLHVLMSQAEMEVWESLADRRRLEVDDVVHAAALSGLKYKKECPSRSGPWCRERRRSHPRSRSPGPDRRSGGDGSRSHCRRPCSPARPRCAVPRASCRPRRAPPQITVFTLHRA